MADNTEKPVYRTAFEESITKIVNGEDPTGSTMPSFITAADTLNEANGNGSFLEGLADTVESVPSFIAVSLLSGANQLYNIPTDLGNLFADEDDQMERYSPEDMIAGIDSDLGRFYQEHKEGADLVGFILSSTVPGLGGVKVLKAGQKSLEAAIGAGKFGANMSKGLGLLVPSKQKFIDLAIKEAATSSSAASITSTNALKAIAAGFGQNTLEVLAFETAVAATMFNSPVLENQDFGDFLANVAWGAGVFGLVGSAIDATKLNYAIKNTVDAAAVADRPWTFIPEAAEKSNSYERVVLDFESLKNIPEIPAGIDPARATKLQAATNTKITTLETRIRKELGNITAGDQEAASALYESFKRTSFQNQEQGFVGLIEASRYGHRNPVASKYERLGKKIAENKASLKEIDEFSNMDIATATVKVWGENTGRTVAGDAPVITNLVDTLKKGQKITVTGTKVVAGSKVYKFDTAFNKKGAVNAKPWNIYKADALGANARYIWASKLPKFEPSAKNPLVVHVDDIPLMEKVFLEVDPQDFKYIEFKGLKEGEGIGANFQDFLGSKKISLANRFLDPQAATARSQEEIAAILNVKSSLLSGQAVKDSTNLFHYSDILAMQHHAEQYTEKLLKNGSVSSRAGTVEIWNVPQHVKLTYDLKPFESIDNHIIEGMTVIKENQKLYQQGTSRASANVLGEDYAKFEDITSGKVYSGAVPSGSGPSFIASANGNYGSLASTVENIGRTTSRVIEKFKERTRSTLEPLLYKVMNSQEAAIEWSVLNHRIRSIEGQFGLNAAGDALEPLAILRWKAAAMEAASQGKAAPRRPQVNIAPENMVIPIKNADVRQLAKAHIEVNGGRTAKLAGIRTAQGTKFNRDPEAFYPIPVDPRDYPYFAIVSDESITSGNHVKTLYANSEKELQQMIDKLKQNPHLKVRTKKEARDYFESIGQYDYEKSFTSNYLDVEAHRKGVSASLLPPTDPKKVATDTLSWHMQREAGLVREAVGAKYEVQFNELLRLGDEFTNAATSKFSERTVTSFAEDIIKNPFADYIKTALNISKQNDYPMWTNPNKYADQVFSRVMAKAAQLVSKAPSTDDLAEVNRLLTQAGYKGAAYDESMQIFANSEAAKGTLSNIVRKANTLLATIVLRWDPMNAVNNAISANVLLGAEAKAVIRAIERGDDKAVGALASLAKMKVPGTDKTILAPQKLIANAMKKFHGNVDDLKFYKENGFLTDISDQYRKSIDDLTYRVNEPTAVWGARVDGVHEKLRKLGDKGEFITGNKLAEEFNRFVAADVMKQLTDLAVAGGKMTPKEALSYINTFVNRTQGNYLAAQRPLMFQGPVGQAIGLFQTYQFNLMQQLLRHVGEGHTKDAMTLLALQGTIHGMNGLPAFNAINTHLIGTASGNTEHKDIYSATYGIVGKEAGDWLLYGAASNALGLIDPDLKVNLYTRGDINPRHVTIVPTDPSSVPIVQATAKFFNNLFDISDKISAGADVSTALLQGLEHNGLSRPLAGLAQTLEAMDNPEAASYSTSKQGNVIAANDLFSLANLGRIAGAKPMDEAVALDATFRYKAYALKDDKKMQVLGEAIKTTLIAGKEPTQEEVENFIGKYTELGGRQENFNKWFAQLYKTANTSQANVLLNDLRSPFSQSMQKIMGGEELRDFNSEAVSQE